MTKVTKEKKKEIIEDLRNNAAQQNGLFFVNFKGIDGEDIRSLRKDLRSGESRMMVARKTLAKIDFDKEGVAFDPLSLEGEVAFVFSFEDAIETAKLLRRFDKEGMITILGGMYEGKELSAEQVREIAELPTREELLAKLLGTVSAPMGSFVNVLQGNMRDLVSVLDQKSRA